MKHPKFKSRVLTRVWNRINIRNKNWLCIVTGGTGSGKSYSAMKIASMIDPNFTIDKVVFTPEEFMALITNGIKKGSIIIFDEAGVGIPSREWYSLSNKMLSYVLQTFRFMNLGVIFTTPSIGFIDAQARRLFHTYIETEKIDKPRQEVVAKIKEMQHNPELDKIYFKNPRKHGIETERIQKIKIGKPPQELINAYEKKKGEYAEGLYDQITEGIEKINVRVTKPISDKEIMDQVLKHLPPEKVTIAKIAAITNVPYHRARKIRAKIGFMVDKRLDLI